MLKLGKNLVVAVVSVTVMLGRQLKNPPRAVTTYENKSNQSLLFSLEHASICYFLQPTNFMHSKH